MRTQKINTMEQRDNIMRARTQPNIRPKVAASDQRRDTAVVTCFECGWRGHKARACYYKQWCNRCRSSTHRDSTCRRRQINDEARTTSEDNSNIESGDAYVFWTREAGAGLQQQQDLKATGMMVDKGATS